jgi:hypothetical protein
MNTAKVLKLNAPNGYGRKPDVHSRIKGNGRAIAVAKFRELADKLESGELDGARVQWLDTHELRYEVDVDGEIRELAATDKSEVPEGAQLISGLEFVTRSAWSEDGSGCVKLRGITIEEEGY